MKVPKYVSTYKLALSLIPSTIIIKIMFSLKLFTKTMCSYAHV